MNHLSEEQIVQWAAGERSADAELHVADCPACRVQVAGFADVLAQFRHSAQGVAAPAPCVPARKPMVWRRLATVAAAMALLSAASIYHQGRERQQALVAQQDALLLQQVDAEISRVVPGSMDPLVKLVSWNAGSTEHN
ncbi:MAG TPA: hypothetical protein VG456_11260 [Candidatus Sulfopaludibacter sp.]|jgi:hypothetical protein|nr:hypothetical protein [Candidatus Sulfopaludibacter sp.]